MTLHDKIMMLLSDEDWRGYLNNIYGNPILIDNCQKGIDSIEISGNYIDGIGVGDGSLNLFDPSKILDVTVEDGVIQTTGVATVSYTMELDVNKSYTISWKSDITVVKQAFQFKWKANGVQKGERYLLSGDGLIHVSGCDQLIFSSVWFIDSSVSKTGFIVSDLMMVEGNYSDEDMPDYVPYDTWHFVGLNINDVKWNVLIPNMLICNADLCDKLILYPSKQKALVEFNCTTDEEGNPIYKEKETIDISDLQDWDSFPSISETTNQIFVSSATPPSAIKYKFHSTMKNELPIVSDHLLSRFDGEFSSTIGRQADSRIWQSISDKVLLDVEGCSWKDKGIFIPTNSCISGMVNELNEYSMDFVFTTDNTDLTDKKISIIDNDNLVITDICDYKSETTFFISVVVVNGGIKIFKDGFLISQCDISDNMKNSNDNLVLKLAVGTDENWSGVIHMCNIYDTALSELEIKRNYVFNKKRYGG